MFEARSILTLILGPIVRINPGILCINDPEAYDEIYVSEAKRKTNNYQPFSQGLGFDGESFHLDDLIMRKLKIKQAHIS